MIRAAITFRRREGNGVRRLVVELSQGYGVEAQTAHELLSQALTAATHPVVLDSRGSVHRILKKRLVGFLVWEVPLAGS
jgi:hypothetical protein